jgi:hypothetical protein
MTLRLRSKMAILQISPELYFFCGGTDSYLKNATRSAFIYNIKTLKAEELHKIQVKKCDPGIYYKSNKVFIFGGYNPSINNSLRSCERYCLD